MKQLRYFRYRLAIFFSLFAFTLSFLFSHAFMMGMHRLDDKIRYDLLLEFETKSLNNYQQAGELLLGDSIFDIQVLRSDRDLIPQKFRDVTIGYHEFQHQSVHLVKGQLPSYSSGDHIAEYYFIHHDDDSHPIRHNISEITTTFILVVLFISLIGLLIGLRLAKQIAQPVQDLNKKIVNTSAESLNFTPLDRQDEFGEISLAFSDTLNRIRQAFEREKQFSSYASHELRTPVAIIKSSLNLWQACREIKDAALAAEKQNAAIQRIAIASEQMEEVIQTFLLLSRHHGNSFDMQTLAIDPLLSELIDKFKTLESYHSIRVNLQLAKNITANGNRTITNVIFTTLLRNSFEYCAGQIDIKLDQQTLTISNDIDQLKIEQADHFGFGLEIVRQLCDKQGWQNQAEKINDSQYLVKIHFK